MIVALVIYAFWHFGVSVGLIVVLEAVFVIAMGIQLAPKAASPFWVKMVYRSLVRRVANYANDNDQLRSNAAFSLVKMIEARYADKLSEEGRGPNVRTHRSPAVADDKIVSDFAAFMAKGGKVDCFYDVNLLPHPKEAILAAIEREIVREPLEERVKWLRTGMYLLWNFQEGVGPAPLPLTGIDFAQLPRDGAPAERLRELDRIYGSPNLRQDEERAKGFKTIAEREAKQIEERIAAAVRMRNARPLS